MFGIYFTSCIGIAAVKSHEAKPSAISPLYQKRVEYIPEFHDCLCYNILIPWLYNGGAISLFHAGRWYFTSSSDISRRQANRGIPVKYPIYFILPLYIFCWNNIQPWY